MAGSSRHQLRQICRPQGCEIEGRLSRGQTITKWGAFQTTQNLVCFKLSLSAKYGCVMLETQNATRSVECQAGVVQYLGTRDLMPCTPRMLQFDATVLGHHIVLWNDTRAKRDAVKKFDRVQGSVRSITETSSPCRP